MSHYRMVCRLCSATTAQCRCYSRDKQIRYIVCAKCARAASTFTCSVCSGVFEKAWTEEEAVAEMRAKFGDLPEAQRAVVCGDCIAKVDDLIYRSTN